MVVTSVHALLLQSEVVLVHDLLHPFPMEGHTVPAGQLFEAGYVRRAAGREDLRQPFEIPLESSRGEDLDDPRRLRTRVPEGVNDPRGFNT